MPKESNSMKEIHKIRIQNYLNTKNMTLAEKIKYINEGADQALKKMSQVRK